MQEKQHFSSHKSSKMYVLAYFFAEKVTSHPFFRVISRTLWLWLQGIEAGPSTAGWLDT